MTEAEDQKAVLRRYLQAARDALVWKLDGLSEREARLPRTPTGNNLLGLVKHCLNVEAGYFGPPFGRQFPQPQQLVSDQELEEDPQADWYAEPGESKDGLIELFRRVWAFCDRTIDQLPLDAPGQVPWWPEDRRDVTLQQVMVHVTCDLARHAGQADILREQIDATVGSQPAHTNIPGGYDWEVYVAKLHVLADRFD
jgi:uncharacterized damage-inducible protein DinB